MHFNEKIINYLCRVQTHIIYIILILNSHLYDETFIYQSYNPLKNKIIILHCQVFAISIVKTIIITCIYSFLCYFYIETKQNYLLPVIYRLVHEQICYYCTTIINVVQATVGEMLCRQQLLQITIISHELHCLIPLNGPFNFSILPHAL